MLKHSVKRFTLWSKPPNRLHSRRLNGITRANVVSWSWIALVLLVGVNKAQAGNDFVSYDIRVAGLGGAGASVASGAAAVLSNPALLQSTYIADISINGILLDARASAPVLAPNQQLSSSVLAPLGFIGGAMRVHRKVVLAVGLSPAGGGAASYDLPGGGKLQALAGAAILDVAASYAVTDRLSIGISYRPSYFLALSKAPSPTPEDPTARTKLDLNAFVPFAVSAGIHYKIDNDSSVGFFYRSRMTADLKGTADTPLGSFDARTNFGLPDKFALAVDRTFFNKRWLVAAQAELDLYGALDRTIVTTISTPSGPIRQRSVADDKNTWGLKVGSEVWAIPNLLVLRGGVWIRTESGREEHVNAILPYLNYYVNPLLGLGLRFDRVDINVMLDVLLKHGAKVSQTDNGNPGYYGQWAWGAGLGINYRFGGTSS